VFITVQVLYSSAAIVSIAESAPGSKAAQSSLKIISNPTRGLRSNTRKLPGVNVTAADYSTSRE
jgi:hypothetical protein